MSFADGTEQVIDFRPVLHGVLFGPLQDLAQFNTVRLDSEVGTLVWANGADFDTATMHDWPQVRDELVKRAEHVGRSQVGERADKPMEPTRR